MLWECSVSIDGDFAIVGATGTDGNAVMSGAAYVLTEMGRIGWSK